MEKALSYILNGLTISRKAIWQMVRAWADDLFCQVDGHPDVLQPALHFWGTAGWRKKTGRNWLRCCSISDAAHKSFESSVSFTGDESPTVLPLYVHGVYLAATTTDWRCPYRVNEWGTPHSSSLSLICTGTHTSSWNIWLTPVTTPTSVVTYRQAVQR